MDAKLPKSPIAQSAGLAVLEGITGNFCGGGLYSPEASKSKTQTNWGPNSQLEKAREFQSRTEGPGQPRY